MADVFVSYKKEDFDIASRLVTALKQHELSVWWDDGLTPKAAWDASIEREIAAAAAVLVLWTPRSVGSDWVRTEAHYAQDRAKLVPVMLEACPIPLAFMLRQTIDLCGWQGDDGHRQWKKLLAWIADLISGTTGAPASAAGTATRTPHQFHDIVGRLASDEPIVDGALVTAATPAGTLLRDGTATPVMRIVPRGAFIIGSPPTEVGRSVVEGPQKRIEIPAPFAMGIFQVSAGEFESVVGPRQSVAASPAPRRWGLMASAGTSTVQREPASDPAMPVTNVSFDEAQDFVVRLSSATEEAYRLPSEAEWEYACRAGSRGAYAFGDAIDPTMALFAVTTGPKAPGSFRANAFGLHDMHGNVREWTVDLWHESYASTPADGSPATEGHSSMRVVRGGGWSDAAVALRSAARQRATQSIRAAVIGFRVVRALA